MKHYTLRMLIHDAKLFNQLRREYRRTRKNPRTSLQSRLALPSLGWPEGMRASLRELIRTIRMIQGELRQRRRIPGNIFRG